MLHRFGVLVQINTVLLHLCFIKIFFCENWIELIKNSLRNVIFIFSLLLCSANSIDHKNFYFRFTHFATFNPRKNLAMSWSLLCHGSPLARTIQFPSMSSSIELRKKGEKFFAIKNFYHTLFSSWKGWLLWTGRQIRAKKIFEMHNRNFRQYSMWSIRKVKIKYLMTTK